MLDYGYPWRAVTELDPLESLACLADPTRRALYRYVAESGTSVTRDEAANAVGAKRSLVAYHLDRLATDGLLAVEFNRPLGRTGPGAGRPAKRYRRADIDLEVALPPRSYRTAAEILLRALLSARVTPAILQESAREFGEKLGDAGIEQALDRLGFEPRSEHGETVLCNCPFVALRDMDLETTCQMNLALVEGIISASARTDLSCVLEPDDDYCCVRLRPI